MLDKNYRNYKHLFLVYLGCVSILLSLKIDSIGIFGLTISFLYLKFNHYKSLFCGILTLLYILNFRFKPEEFTTQVPITTPPVNNIYYNFLDYFDLTKPQIEFNSIPRTYETILREKWARFFSDNNLIDDKYYIPKNKTLDKLKLDEMLYDTLGRLFRLVNPDNISITPDKNLVNDVVYNEIPGINYTILQEKLRGTQFEYTMKIVFLRLSMRKKDLSSTLNFKTPNIRDSKIKNTTQINNMVKEAEYKTINELNREAESILIDKKDIKHVELLSNLSQQFSSNMISIMEDILSLSGKQLHFTSVYDSYIFYSKQIFYILTDKGRLFYVGLFFMVISICLFFIETTK